MTPLRWQIDAAKWPACRAELVARILQALAEPHVRAPAGDIVSTAGELLLRVPAPRRVLVRCPRIQCSRPYRVGVLDEKAVLTTVDCPFCGVRTHVQTREPPFTKETADPARYFG